ncbi:hypothetical protein HOY82DRAFT_575945 [Tuber indicum]|nr:hypothetical protein HOY82DRAFT_575945 [Tuber indicum]
MHKLVPLILAHCSNPRQQPWGIYSAGRSSSAKSPRLSASANWPLILVAEGAGWWWQEIAVVEEGARIGGFWQASPLYLSDEVYSQREGGWKN